MGKHLCWSLLFLNFIKKRLQHRYFPMKFAKFFRISILKNICERQLLLLLRFTKLYHYVFLWLLWRHRFLYNNNKYSKLVLPLLTSKKFRIKTALKHLNFGCLGYPAPGPHRILTEHSITCRRIAHHRLKLSYYNNEKSLLITIRNKKIPTLP